MSKTVIILGDRSDIAKGLAPFLEADGWTVPGWHLGESQLGFISVHDRPNRAGKPLVENASRGCCRLREFKSADAA